MVSSQISPSKIVLACGLILSSIFIIYFQVRSFEFLNYDDNIYVTENPFVLGGLTWENVTWGFTTTLGGHWHPLSWLSHMLDSELFGVNPGAMHLHNVGLHSANSILLFFLLYITLRNYQVALVSTLLFALHPLRIESVAWISQRKDLLSLFFGLCSCFLFIKFSDTKSKYLYFASFITFVLGLLAKPTIMTLPVMIVILEYVFLCTQKALPRTPFSPSSLINKIPFFLLSILCGANALFSQSTGGGLRTLSEFPILERFNIAFPAFIIYVGKLFWPFETSIYYPVVQYPSGLAFGCFLSMLGVSLLLWRFRNTVPELLLGWIWFVVALLPVAGFLTIGYQACADRWTQLAHVGLIVGIVSYGEKSWHSHVQLFIWPLLLSLSFLTYHELQYWKNSEAIFRRALKVNSNNFLAHTNLGATLDSAQHFEEQAFHYEEAVRLNPTYPEGLNNLGIIRAKQGRFLESMNYFEKALYFNPHLMAARNNLTQVRQEMITRGIIHE